MYAIILSILLSCSVAFSAATYTVGAAQSYSTHALAIAAIGTDLSGQGIQWVAAISGTYNENLGSIAGFTNASASDYILVKPQVGHEHNGDTLQGVRIAIADGINTSFNAAYTVIDGLVFTSKVNSYTLRMFAASQVFKNNIVVNSYAIAGNKRGIYLQSDNAQAYNNIIISVNKPAGTLNNYGVASFGTGNAVHNNNIINFPTCMNNYGASVSYQNNVCSPDEASSAVCSDGTLSANYNACGPCGSGTCAGANTLNSVSKAQFAFADTTAVKYYTAGTYLNAKGVAVAGYSTDIFGVSVEDPPQIGVNFFLSGAGGSNSGCGGILWRMGLAPRRGCN